MRQHRALGSDVDLRRTARRIGLQTAGLLMACLVVVVAVLYGAVVRSQGEQLTTSLTNAVASAGTGRDPDHDHDHDLSEPRGGIQYAVLDGRGIRSSTDVPAGLPDLDAMHAVAATHVQDRRTVHLPTGGFEVLTVQRGDDTVQVMASTFEQHQERERILGSLGLAGGTGLVLATLAAAVLARRAVRPMARALELQRRFVADAGHELRTPLTLLSTRSQLLARRVRDTTTPAARREQLVERDAAGIVADTAALVAILEDLLTQADDRTPVPQEPVDLAEVARSSVASAQATAQGVDVTLRTVIDTTGPTTVLGAATALARAVAALVDNALDHATSEVQVRLSRAGRWVVVEVLDDGPGIPSDTLPRMFDRFASDRRPTTETGARRHFGLGLALVSEIAARHGGTVTAENRPPSQPGALLRLSVPSGPAGRTPTRPEPTPE
ncbi:MAG TPA: HAMP domain-containing sensor histidine kinase [Friedmanniella sp.]